MGIQKKVIAIGTLICSTFIVLTTVGNGCSSQVGGFNTDNPSLGGSDSNGGFTGSGPAPQPIENDFIPGAKTASLVYANQILDHMSLCAGVAKPSDSTLRVFEEKRGAISTTGSVETMNPAMMMAVISVAGEVCQDLINQEAASGLRIFQGFNLAANTLPADGAIKSAISRMAISCWSRQEASDESQRILDMVYKSVPSGEAQATRKASLMICTSMLASLDALLN